MSTQGPHNLPKATKLVNMLETQIHEDLAPIDQD